MQCFDSVDAGARLSWWRAGERRIGNFRISMLEVDFSVKTENGMEMAGGILKWVGCYSRWTGV